jgi:uncharacterized damage-inducible protein DinB
MKKRFAMLGLATWASAAALALAQAPATTSTQVSRAPAPAASAAPAQGFRAEYAAEVDSVGKKLVELAEAIPADKYGWRPAPGVRSVGEVFMHVVGGNSSIPSFVGAQRMDGITRESEKTVTDKAQIVALLKKSIDNAKAAGTVITDADLDKKYKTFGGREMTGRQVLSLIENHMHEHLGQAIAYARMNGITPPWSTS